MICFENVSFKYKNMNRPVLDDVMLSIEDGSFVVVLGRNGSGKSTLAKHINGMLQPTSGKVTVFDMSTSEEQNLKQIHKQVGMVFQNPENQIVHSIVEEEVAFGPENLCLPREKIRTRVDEALETVGMTKYLNSDTHSLSGGQQQRIAVAGVLAARPKCIVFDEATSMLDPKGRKDILKLAHKLNREEGITIVWITHLMREVQNADRVIVMNKGRVFLDDAPGKILARVEDMELLGLGVPQVYELFQRLNVLLQSDENAPIFDLTDIDECVRKLDELLEK